MVRVKVLVSDMKEKSSFSQLILVIIKLCYKAIFKFRYNLYVIKWAGQIVNSMIFINFIHPFIVGIFNFNFLMVLPHYCWKLPNDENFFIFLSLDLKFLYIFQPLFFSSGLFVFFPLIFCSYLSSKCYFSYIPLVTTCSIFYYSSVFSFVIPYLSYDFFFELWII